MSALQERFAGGGAQVVGISCDSVYALKAWADELALAFPMCADFWPHGAVAMRYGVFNAEIGRPERALFVLDAAGIIRYIDVHTLREVPDESELVEQLVKLDPPAPSS